MFNKPIDVFSYAIALFEIQTSHRALTRWWRRLQWRWWLWRRPWRRWWRIWWVGIVRISVGITMISVGIKMISVGIKMISVGIIMISVLKSRNLARQWRLRRRWLLDCFWRLSYFKRSILFWDIFHSCLTCTILLCSIVKPNLHFLHFTSEQKLTIQKLR